MSCGGRGIGGVPERVASHAWHKRGCHSLPRKLFNLRRCPCTCIIDCVRDLWWTGRALVELDSQRRVAHCRHCCHCCTGMNWRVRSFVRNGAKGRQREGDSMMRKIQSYQYSRYYPRRSADRGQVAVILQRCSITRFPGFCWLARASLIASQGERIAARKERGCEWSERLCQPTGRQLLGRCPLEDDT